MTENNAASASSVQIAPKTMKIPSEILKLLRCSLCSEYLSYPPIIIHSETGSVCGRCPALEAENNIQPLRANAYETLAQIFQFPCRNFSSGCRKTNFIKDIPKHELSCKYKQYFCPVLPLGDCPWQGLLSELYFHFAVDHPDLLLESGQFEVDFVNQYRQNLLLPFEETLFLVRNELYEDENMLQVYVALIGSYEYRHEFSYQLKFTSANESTVIKPPSRSIMMDYEKVEDNICLIDLVDLKLGLKEPSNITCEIEIMYVDEPVLITDSEEQETKQVSAPSNPLLMDLECPVCQEYMVPPIFQCSTGHSFCEPCKKQLNACPTCRNAMTEIRNFTLEKLTENIEYACRNSIEGCKYVNKSIQTKKHEQVCNYNPVKCPFLCAWQGKSKSIYNHCKQVHVEKIQKEIFQVNFSGDNFKDGRIIMYDCDSFYVLYTYVNTTRKFSVNVFNLGVSYSRDFMYEISLVDPCLGFELRSKKFCCGFSEGTEDALCCSVWDFKMLEPFFNEQNLMIRCKIINAKPRRFNGSRVVK